MSSSLFLIYHILRKAGRWLVGGALYLVCPQQALEDLEAEHGKE